jgi:hypothetical protein
MKLEKNGETGEDHLDYIPDEGLPALAVLSLFYHEMDFLTSNCIIKQKKQLKKNALNSELSTTLSSPLLKNEQRFTFEKLLALNAEKSKTRLPFSVINTIENNRSYEISKVRQEVIYISFRLKNLNLIHLLIETVAIIKLSHNYYIQIEMLMILMILICKLTMNLMKILL